MGDYYQTWESVKAYIQMAKDVDGGRLIDKLKQFLPAHSNVLELGSGPGTDWKILSKTYQAVGSDNSQEFLRHIKVTNPGGCFLELDAVTLDTTHKFEGIYSNKVLHHLTDEDLSKSILRQHDLLEPNGIICHSFWKGEGSEIFKGLFVNYHTSSSLKSFFGAYFDLLLTESYMEFESGDSLLMVAKRK